MEEKMLTSKSQVILVGDNWRPFLDHNFKSTIPTYSEYVRNKQHKKSFTSIFSAESKNSKIRKMVETEKLTPEEAKEREKLLVELKKNIKEVKKRITENDSKHQEQKEFIREKKQEELDRQRMQVELWNEQIKTKSQSVIHVRKVPLGTNGSTGKVKYEGHKNVNIIQASPMGEGKGGDVNHRTKHKTVELVNNVIKTDKKTLGDKVKRGKINDNMNIDELEENLNLKK